VKAPPFANGADPNLADNAGRTPLMLAVSLGNEVLVRGLLAAKADPSAADSEGMTAKDWAEKHNRPELIELLELPTAGSNCRTLVGGAGWTANRPAAFG